jgi:hypothetical protein
MARNVYYEAPTLLAAAAQHAAAQKRRRQNLDDSIKRRMEADQATAKLGQSADELAARVQDANADRALRADAEMLQYRRAQEHDAAYLSAQEAMNQADNDRMRAIAESNDALQRQSLQATERQRIQDRQHSLVNEGIKKGHYFYTPAQEQEINTITNQISAVQTDDAIAPDIKNQMIDSLLEKRQRIELSPAMRAGPPAPNFGEKMNSAVAFWSPSAGKFFGQDDNDRPADATRAYTLDRSGKPVPVDKGDPLPVPTQEQIDGSMRILKFGDQSIPAIPDGKGGWKTKQDFISDDSAKRAKRLEDQYDAAFKALTTQDDQGNLIYPNGQQIAAYIRNRQQVIDAIGGETGAAPAPATAAPTAPAPVPQAQQGSIQPPPSVPHPPPSAPAPSPLPGGSVVVPPDHTAASLAGPVAQPTVAPPVPHPPSPPTPAPQGTQPQKPVHELYGLPAPRDEFEQNQLEATHRYEGLAKKYGHIIPELKLGAKAWTDAMRKGQYGADLSKISNEDVKQFDLDLFDNVYGYEVTGEAEPLVGPDGSIGAARRGKVYEADLPGGRRGHVMWNGKEFVLVAEFVEGQHAT